MHWDEFTKKAIGVPFQLKGRTFDGWDCWGLVWRAYWEVRGIVLPSYASRYESIKDYRKLARLFRHGSEWRWAEVESPRQGDVAAILRRGVPLHCGIVIEDGSRILHVEEGIETVHEPVTRFSVEGYFRL